MILTQILYRIGWDGLIVRINVHGIHSNNNVSPRDFKSWDELLTLCNTDAEKEYVCTIREFILYCETNHIQVLPLPDYRTIKYSG